MAHHHYDVIKGAKQQRPDGWGNCPKCGWFYLQTKLDHCPMCRHPWKLPVAYQQPEYEPPTL